MSRRQTAKRINFEVVAPCLEFSNKTMSQSTVVRCVLGHAEEQEENKTLFIPFQAEGDKPTVAGDSSCRRHLHSSTATAQRITLNQGMTSQVNRGVGNGAITTTLFAVQRKAGFELGLVSS